jgi:hypothetical protein
MNTRNAVRLGKILRTRLGAHYRMASGDNYTSEAYQQARADSDEAERLLRYLAMHLADRHAAVVLCSAAGAPGYINFR